MNADEQLEAGRQALRRWVESLPDGVAKISETEAPSEYVIQVTPKHENAAEVTFRISDYGTFGLYTGSAIRIEELPLSVDYLLEICEAVVSGDLEDELWTRSGKLLKAKTTLHLPSGDLHGTQLKGGLGTMGADEHVERSYESYTGEGSAAE